MKSDYWNVDDDQVVLIAPDLSVRLMVIYTYEMVQSHQYVRKGEQRQAIVTAGESLPKYIYE